MHGATTFTRDPTLRGASVYVTLSPPLCQRGEGGVSLLFSIPGRKALRSTDTIILLCLLWGQSGSTGKLFLIFDKLSPEKFPIPRYGSGARSFPFRFKGGEGRDLKRTVFYCTRLGHILTVGWLIGSLVLRTPSILSEDRWPYYSEKVFCSTPAEIFTELCASKCTEKTRLC